MRALLVLFGLAILLLAAAAAAQPAEQVEGTIRSSKIRFAGPTTIGVSGADACYVKSADDVRRETTWTLTSSSVTVNWTHHASVGFASRPDNPNASFVTYKKGNESDERTYADATVRGVANNVSTDLLVLPDSRPFAAEAALDNGLAFAATGQEKWVAGFLSDGSVQASDSEAFLIHSFQPAAGTPLLETGPHAAIGMTGDVVVFVWGFDVTAEGAEARESFQSGTWWANATGAQLEPRGAAREEHASLLRLTARDAVVTVDHRTGGSQCAFSQGRLETAGSVRFYEATGILNSTANVYRVENDDLLLRGTVNQSLGRGNAGALESGIVANAAVDATTASVIAVPAGTTANPWGWILAAAFLVCAAVIAFTWWRREAPLREMKQDERYAIMISKDPAKAERRLRWRRRWHPNDAEAIILHAQSFLALGRNHDMVRKFKPCLRQGKEFEPTLAYLLAKACARLRRKDEAFAMLKLATKDKLIRQQIQLDQELQALLFRRPPRAAGVALQTGYA